MGKERRVWPVGRGGGGVEKLGVEGGGEGGDMFWGFGFWCRIVGEDG